MRERLCQCLVKPGKTEEKKKKQTELGGNLSVPFEGTSFYSFFWETQQEGCQPYNDVWRCNRKARPQFLTNRWFFGFFLSALVPVVTHFNQTTMDSLNKKKVLVQEQRSVQSDGLALVLFHKVEATR